MTQEHQGEAQPPHAEGGQCRADDERRAALEGRMIAIQGELVALQRRTFWVHTASLIVLAIYAGFTLAAARATRDAANATKISADAAKIAAKAALKANKQNATQFQLAQRARMVLGRPDGPIMELAQRGGRQTVRIYLRNMGALPARDVNVEAWPILTPPMREVDMSNDFPDEFTGPTVPPGVVHAEYVQIPPNQVALIGKATTTIVARIRYRDDFGTYCEAVCGLYWGDERPSRPEFELCPTKTTICTPGKHVHYFFGFKIRPGESVELPTHDDQKREPRIYRRPKPAEPRG